ncbi:helix-turn-helix domain-containing protein [Evansella clarkii]|uniref:helix-turn-helix domain-containing protein n=1 Tax=Evansella clarkii TaxID=79879 RepID=UPI0009975586|nr:helix-turn-helix transcriptional regulator [Evansella clarkii]
MPSDSLELERLSLYDMRLASGKSGSGITRLCGTTYRSLRNWETGAAVPNIVNIHDLLQIYGYSFYELALAPFYRSQPHQDEKQKRIAAAARKRTPVSSPPKSLTLYEMRKTSGYSGMVVADICGVSYRSLLNWEKGAAIPNVIHVDDLLKIYGYSFYELDLAPFYTAYEARVIKQRRTDARADSPLRDPRRFKQTFN